MTPPMAIEANRSRSSMWGLPAHTRPRLRPLVYWLDLLTSVAAGATCFVLAVALSPGSVGWLGLSLVAALAWLRALVFLHEITHRAREIRGFEVAWGLLVGLPMGVPTLMYVGSHPSHHRRDRCGTAHDPEYTPLARWGSIHKLLFVAISTLAPVALLLRWGVLTPLSLVVPGFRSWVVARCSTLSINPSYVRSPPMPSERLRWLAGEASACLSVWAIGASLLLGFVPWTGIAHWLLLISCVFAINQARTVLAHRYGGGGHPGDDRFQLADSLTLPEGSWLAALIAPVGLRYHALHHWAPGIPYHELGRVHRRLVTGASRNDPYLETLTPSLPAALQAQLGSSHGASP